MELVKNMYFPYLLNDPHNNDKYDNPGQGLTI